MEKEILELLNIIELNGFKCYIIGGFVRDKLLGINSYDVDIVTNALPKDLIVLFNNYQTKISDYGTVKIITDEYRIDIATLRKELSYNGRKPDKIEYIDDLKEDILRRDFTINTIAMDKDGLIIDELNAMKDLQNKLIKSVGNANEKIQEDPLRILRAIRFSITLDFKLEDELLKSIKKNIELIKTLPLSRVKEELNKILISPNSISGLDFMNKIKILKLLNISYNNLIYVDDLMGMYAQLNISDDYPFTKEELRNINAIKSIIKEDKINNITLYNNDLYISLVAAKILKIDKEDIISMYNNLPIKKDKDLDINYNEIKKILDVDPNIINKIEKDIINKVLLNELSNKKDELISYIINNKEMYLNE